VEELTPAEITKLQSSTPTPPSTPPPPSPSPSPTPAPAPTPITPNTSTSPVNLQNDIASYRQAYEQEWEQAEGQRLDIVAEAAKHLDDNALCAAQTLTGIMLHGRNDSVRLKAAIYVYERAHPLSGTIDPLEKLVQQLTKGD